MSEGNGARTILVVLKSGEKTVALSIVSLEPMARQTHYHHPPPKRKGALYLFTRLVPEMPSSVIAAFRGALPSAFFYFRCNSVSDNFTVGKSAQVYVRPPIIHLAPHCPAARNIASTHFASVHNYCCPRCRQHHTRQTLAREVYCSTRCPI